MRKKVLFLINTLSCGGAERALINAVKLLPGDKYDFTVISVTGGDFESDLPPFIEYKKIIKSKNPFIKKTLSYFVYRVLPKKMFCKLFIKGDFNIAVSFLEGFPTKVISNFKNSDKKIAFVHYGITENDLSDIGYKDKSQLNNDYEKFDNICFVSESAKQCFINLIGNKDNYSVVHNFIDADSIIKKSNEPTEEIFSKDVIKIVTVGRLAKFKGHLRLIETAKKLEDKFNFEIVIIGDGDEYSSLKNKIIETDCHSVKLLGFNSNPYKYIKQADFYISSSLSSEGYNTAVIEALILGLPVVTTNSNGMSEILQNGKYGIITDLDDLSLLKGLEQMFSDDILLKYKKNVSELDKNYFLKNAITGYTEIFEN